MPYSDFNDPDNPEKRWFDLQVEGDSANPNAALPRTITADLAAAGDPFGFYAWDADTSTWTFYTFVLDRREKFYCTDMSVHPDTATITDVIITSGDDMAGTGTPVSSREAVWSQVIPVTGWDKQAPEGEWLWTLEPFFEVVGGVEITRNDRLRGNCTNAREATCILRGFVE